MSDVNLKALAEALLASLAPTQAETTVVVTETPEMAAAKVERHAAIRAAAKELAKAEMDANDAFDAEVMLQMVSGQAYRARDQYLWSRNQAEYQAKLLAQEQEIGARTSDDYDGAEINELANREQNVSFHSRNMEQYEIQLAKAEYMWQSYATTLRRAGQDITFIPNFDISERAFAEYVDKRIAEARARGRGRADATVAAHRVVADTTLHFLSKEAA